MTKHVLFEIGMEELPARFIDDAQQQLKEKTAKWLQDLRIAYDSITSFSTPRRLAVRIENIADMQTTIEEEARGPAVAIAKDETGAWTKAAIGFAKGQGKTVEDLVEKEVNGKAYVFVTKRIEGRATKDLLPEFKDIITSISFPNNMRWGTHTLRFARPIRWLVALYGQEIVPFNITDVETSDITYGHRYLGKSVKLEDAMEYEGKLKENFVIADANERRARILEGIEELQTEQAHVIVDEDLLAEVTNLVEYPTVFKGEFEEMFLDLPSEVLIISMKEHQRYFPVKSLEGKLLPFFIGVRNGDDTALDTVVKGNEKVLRARLQDAEFFYEEDQKNTIDHHLEKLTRVVFQEKLGTLAEKTERVTALTERIAENLNFSNGMKDDAIRAAEISKFDLMTNMVNEFTELQGVIGEIYALNYNEKETVATAIREQYLPTHAKGELPESEIGAILSVAEKIDTIIGIIAVGMTPTGSQDPYALRRQAIGVLRILEEGNWEMNVEDLLQIAYGIYDELEIEKIDDYKEKIHEFFKLRASYLLKEAGIEQDIFQAVMDKEIGNFTYAMAKARHLSEKRHDVAFKEKEEALVRILNLADKAESMDITPEAFETDSEKALYEQFEQSKIDFKAHDEAHDAIQAFEQLEALARPIHGFFDNNMVMTDNKELRNNRLALVAAISSLILEYANLALIEWKQQF
ncbi:glycine--tRNA ligase subunit beta [Oceanobacillus alkalisoli]|uniref:glycine--tRNA ligase subunit beta n=1 Tax=Oceanobacillus alkalisoli TaxID=2925113 RepID=UPI001EE434D6|nr:glycine--tRNA ligase subunit beta [Oceanobacillus alkalisoli]MCG5103075.1 glycine--tRNA ligase subunit beta [Oceanobacillus alkalisoli]